MKFDSNQAWKQATAAMAANRELWIALAGVFFFLPSFALIMLFKQPQVPPGATSEQMMPVIQEYASSIGHWLVVASFVQALGQVTLVELFGRGGRATVGEALRNGVGSLFTFVLAQLLIGLMLIVIFALVLGLGGMVSQWLGLALGLYAVLQGYARFVTTGPVIMLEGKLNPFTALVRAVTLSRGNGFRIGNFLFLLALAVVFVLSVLSMIVGIIAALTMGEGRTAEIVTGAISSLASAVVLTYFVAITVAIYRQLSGDEPDRVSAAFD